MGFIFPLTVLAEADADALFAAGDWAAATAAYAERTASDPQDAVAWYRLGVSARQAGQPDTARAALQKAAALEFSPIRIGFERARLNVLAQEPDAAVAELQAVAAQGFTSVGVITGDALLSGLSGHAGYDALLAEMSVKAYPCEHDPSFRAFDFWVGDWDVHDAAGNLAGRNVIERAEHGCVLIENWQGAGGSTGTSINFLDKSTGEWVQVWNAAGGSQIQIRGTATAAGMQLTGTIHYVANGTTAPFRGLWTALPDGRVRQFFEQSADDGDTWTPWFEGFYTRRAAE